MHNLYYSIMGQATSLILREQIFKLHQQGTSLKSISQQLSVPYSTVKKLCRKFRTGENGLVPDYSRCGSNKVRFLDKDRGPSIMLKEQHPTWGAPRISVELQFIQTAQPPEGGSPSGKGPSIRSLQRWYRKAGLYRPRRQGKEPAIGRSTATHNILEVDAKENLTLTDGSPACYLTMADEYSGAWTEAPVFPLQANLPGAAGGRPKGTLPNL